MTSLLRAEAVGKNFTQPDGQSLAVLKSIDLDLEAGQITALLGASGSGKTTLLRILSGIDQPDRGNVSSAVTRPGPSLGYLSQHDALLPWRTALENVALGAELAGETKRAALQRAEQALADVGMTSFADSDPSQLSGGMRQRVLLARIFALRPTLLLLDEPMSSLDVLARRDMANLIRTYAHAHQAAVLVVTHSVEEACFLADRVLLVTRTPAQIFKAIELADNKAARDAALGPVMHDLWSALGVVA